MALMPTDLPEPVVPAISRCGMLGEIRAHRRAADVLAERERQRRGHVVVGLGLDDLAERDDLALLVRDLEAHDRLAGNDFDHAHADGGQRTREILGEAGDLADLDAGRRTHLEARDHGPGLHGDDFRPRRRNRLSLSSTRRDMASSASCE